MSIDLSIDEARAICDSSNDVHFIGEHGYGQLVTIEERTFDDVELAEHIETAWLSDRMRYLCEAALIVLRDKIAAEAQKVAREAEAL